MSVVSPTEGRIFLSEAIANTIEAEYWIADRALEFAAVFDGRERSQRLITTGGKVTVRYFSN